MTPIEISERARRLQRQAEEWRAEADRRMARLAVLMNPTVRASTHVEVTLRLGEGLAKLGRALDPAVQNWISETSRRLVAELRKKHPEWSWYTGAPTLDEYLRRVRWRRLDVERWQRAPDT